MYPHSHWEAEYHIKCLNVFLSQIVFNHFNWVILSDVTVLEIQAMIILAILGLGHFKGQEILEGNCGISNFQITKKIPQLLPYYVKNRQIKKIMTFIYTLCCISLSECCFWLKTRVSNHHKFDPTLLPYKWFS